MSPERGAFKKIGWWIGGAIVVTAAVGIASVFYRRQVELWLIVTDIH